MAESAPARPVSRGWPRRTVPATRRVSGPRRRGREPSSPTVRAPGAAAAATRTAHVSAATRAPRGRRPAASPRAPSPEVDAGRDPWRPPAAARRGSPAACRAARHAVLPRPPAAGPRCPSSTPSFPRWRPVLRALLPAEGGGEIRPSCPASWSVVGTPVPTEAPHRPDETSAAKRLDACSGLGVG